MISCSPGVEDNMEGCPDDDVNLLYLVVSGLMGVVIFVASKLLFRLRGKLQKKEAASKMKDMAGSEDFKALQEELYVKK